MRASATSGAQSATTNNADEGPKARYRDLTPAQRMLSTGHPHLFYWAAAISAVVFSGLGVWIMTRSVIAGIVVVALAIAASLVVAWPGHWSERHPQQARQAVEVQRDLRNRMARRHPAYFVVVIPIIAAVDAALRFNRDKHHPSTMDWVIPAAIGLAFGLALGIVLVYRARHSQTTHQPARSVRG